MNILYTPFFRIVRVRHDFYSHGRPITARGCDTEERDEEEVVAFFRLWPQAIGSSPAKHVLRGEQRVENGY